MSHHETQAVLSVWEKNSYGIMQSVLKDSEDNLSVYVKTRYAKHLTRLLVNFDIAELYKVRQKILDEVADCDSR